MGMFNYLKSNVALPVLGKTEMTFVLKNNDDLDSHPTMDTYLIDTDRKLYKEYDGSDLWDSSEPKYIHTFINFTGELKFYYSGYKRSDLIDNITFTAIFGEGELWCVEIEVDK